MNKRQEVANRIWLKGWGGPDGRAVPVYPLTRCSVADLLHDIGHGFRYKVSLRQDADTYYVQLFPGGSEMALCQPPVCLSYSGTSLRSIMEAARQELARLRNPENQWEAATREVIRWVP